MRDHGIDSHNKIQLLEKTGRFRNIMKMWGVINHPAYASAHVFRAGRIVYLQRVKPDAGHAVQAFKEPWVKGSTWVVFMC